jgi:hypothetical protein
LTSLTESYEELPLYKLAVLADRQENGEQVILVALVYDSYEDAETAADELTARLAAFSNVIVTGSESPVIDDIEGASMTLARVNEDEATGQYIAIAEARYPMPESILYNKDDEPAQEGETGMTRSPGRLFRQWVDAIYQRAFYPLAVSE